MFAVDDYLKLYNQAFDKSVQPSNLQGNDPIVNRIARHEGIETFDHGRPADVLLRQRDKLLPQFSADTFARFEQLFERINATFPGA